MRSFGGGKGRFVKKTDSPICGKRGRKGISRSTSKFKEKIGAKQADMREEEEADSCQASLRARKLRLEAGRR